MYTENDFLVARKNASIRLILLIVLGLAFVAGVIVFNKLRIQAATMACAAVGFAVTYFLWSFKVSPWMKYNKYMREMKNGRKRITACEYVYFTPETRLFDGVEVHELVVRVGNEEEDERLFYWDADKPAPEFNEGDSIEIESYGNFVVKARVV